MSNNIINILLFITTIVNLVFATFLYFRNRKNLIHIYYSITVCMVALWSLSLFLYRISSNQTIALFTFRFAYIFAFLIAVFFFYFSIYFPYPNYILRKKHHIFFIIISFFVLILSLSPFLMKGFTNFPLTRHYNYSTFVMVIYAIIFLIIFAGAFYNMFTKIKMGGIIKVQLKYILLGTIVAGLGGIIFELFLPLFGIQSLEGLGPVFTLFMIIYVTYFIFFFKPDARKRY